MESEEIKSAEVFKMFGGYYKTFTFYSNAINGVMKFGIYLPPNVANCEDKDAKFAALWYLSGLTCFESLFFQKCSLGMKKAADLGLILIFPDTSPRDVEIEGDRKDWDFGVAASYYVDATQEKWSKNYNMYTHITKELRDVVEEHFPVDPKKQSITGHSVGGHGSLVIYMKNLERYVSCSVFAPMTNPINCGWGQKAFTNLFGEDNLEEWKKWDACELAKSLKGHNIEILLDQGDKDCFYPTFMLTDNFIKAGEEGEHKFTVHIREGYDHGFAFINTFIESHLDYHWGKLNQ